MTDTDNIFRSAAPQDEVSIYQLFCVPEVYKYLADGEEPPPEVASAWVNSAAYDKENYGGGLWVLTDDANLVVNGLVRLAADDNRELELTYLLHPNLWGHGFATRMAHTVMKQALKAGLVSTIWAGADVPNKASIAVMERLGMQFRRKIEYPLGMGLEYQMGVEEFNPSKY